MSIYGYISYNLFQRKTFTNQHELTIIPLISSCHLEKNAVCEVFTKDFFLLKNFDNYPLSKNQILKFCTENKNKLKDLNFNEIIQKLPEVVPKDDYTFVGDIKIRVYCILKIAKPEHQIIGGSVWCTQLLNESKQAPEEFWLCKEKTSISSFIISFIHNKNLRVPKNNIIYYEIDTSNEMFAKGAVVIEGKKIFLFSKNISL